MSAEIFGFTDRKTLTYAQDLGTAFQLTNILRDVREDAARGRYYLPQDELAMFGVSKQDLQQPVTSARVIDLFKMQEQRAREYYLKAFSELPAVDRYQQRPGLIMASIYQTLLDEIKLDGFRVLEHKIKLPPLRKLWLAWRAARHEKKRYKDYLKSSNKTSAE